MSSLRMRHRRRIPRNMGHSVCLRDARHVHRNGKEGGQKRNGPRKNKGEQDELSSSLGALASLLFDYAVLLSLSCYGTFLSKSVILRRSFAFFLKQNPTCTPFLPTLPSSPQIPRHPPSDTLLRRKARLCSTAPSFLPAPGPRLGLGSQSLNVQVTAAASCKSVGT